MSGEKILIETDFVSFKAFSEALVSDADGRKTSALEYLGCLEFEHAQRVDQAVNYPEDFDEEHRNSLRTTAAVLNYCREQVEAENEEYLWLLFALHTPPSYAMQYEDRDYATLSEEQYETFLSLEPFVLRDMCSKLQSTRLQSDVSFL